MSALFFSLVIFIQTLSALEIDARQMGFEEQRPGRKRSGSFRNANKVAANKRTMVEFAIVGFELLYQEPESFKGSRDDDHPIIQKNDKVVRQVRHLECLSHAPNEHNEFCHYNGYCAESAQGHSMEVFGS